MEINGKAEELIVRSMKLLRDKLDSEKTDDLPEIVTNVLDENIKILDELVGYIENGEFFLELTEC